MPWQEKNPRYFFNEESMSFNCRPTPACTALQHHALGLHRRANTIYGRQALLGINKSADLHMRLLPLYYRTRQWRQDWILQTGTRQIPHTSQWLDSFRIELCPLT
jgi:hypothetical protein